MTKYLSSFTDGEKMWSVYLECNGQTLYADVELDDFSDEDPLDQASAWQQVSEIILQTLEVRRYA